MRRKQRAAVRSTLILASVVGLLASPLLVNPAAADAVRSGGSRTCPAGHYVTIYSFSAGIVTHSWSQGPEHLGFKTYHDRFSPSGSGDARVTPTFRRSIYMWRAEARHIPGTSPSTGWIREAFSYCDAF